MHGLLNDLCLEQQHRAHVATEEAQTRALGLTPCDCCGQPAVVLVCAAPDFSSNRCANCIVSTPERFARLGRRVIVAALDDSAKDLVARIQTRVAELEGGRSRGH